MAKRGKYQCPYCGRQTFANQREYRAHLRTHTDRRDKIKHGRAEPRKPRVDRRRGKFL